MQLAWPLSSRLFNPPANSSYSRESKCFVKIDGMKEIPPIKKCPMASTTLNETPENPSRTAMGEGRGLSGDWPPGRQSLDKPVQSRTCPSSMSWSLPCFWHRSPLPPSARQCLLPLPSWVCCRATEGLGLPRPPCSAHPRLSMQPFFAACGNPLPPAPLVLQIKPRVILVWAFCCLPLLRRAASQVEGTARGQDLHEGIKPRLSAPGAAHTDGQCVRLQSPAANLPCFFPLVCPGQGRVHPTPPWLDGSSSPAPRIEPQLSPLLGVVPPAVWGNHRPCTLCPAPLCHAISLQCHFCTCSSPSPRCGVDLGSLLPFQGLTHWAEEKHSPPSAHLAPSLWANGSRDDPKHRGPSPSFLSTETL